MSPSFSISFSFLFFCLTLENVWYVGNAVCSAGPHDVLPLYLQTSDMSLLDVFGYFYSPLLSVKLHEASVTH